MLDDEKNVVNHHKPPRTQPSLWCGWQIQPDHKTIVGTGIEKFYGYVDWLLYITKILKDRGKVAWCGEEMPDAGTLHLTPCFLHVRWIDTKTLDVKSGKIRLYQD